MNFFQSDIGKVVLGGIVTISAQIFLSLFTWFKESRAEKNKKTKEAEFLAINLVIVLDDFVGECFNSINDSMQQDERGLWGTTVKYPSITLPIGEYTSLPSGLMFEIISIPKRLRDILENLKLVGEESYPPDYFEYHKYRREHFSHIGLQALNQINALNKHYQIPDIRNDDQYDPKACFMHFINKAT